MNFNLRVEDNLKLSRICLSIITGGREAGETVAALTRCYGPEGLSERTADS